MASGAYFRRSPLGHVFLNPSSMLYRSPGETDTEEMIRAQPLDGARFWPDATRPRQPLSWVRRVRISQPFWSAAGRCYPAISVASRRRRLEPFRGGSIPAASPAALLASLTTPASFRHALAQAPFAGSSWVAAMSREANQ